MMKKTYSEFKEGMEMFGENITAVINAILMTIAYFLGVGIVSLIAKGIRKKFLDTGFEKDKDSYWEELDHDKRKTEDYYKQF